MQHQDDFGRTDRDPASVGDPGMGGAGAGSLGSSGFGGGTGSPAFGSDTASMATATDHQLPADTGQAQGGGAGNVSGRMEEIRTQAEKGMKQAADRLDTLAQRIDSTADQRLAGATGTRARAGELAHGLADTMESVAGYLRNNDVGSLQRDLEREVRERPVQTLLIGVAAGWVVGKILR